MNAMAVRAKDARETAGQRGPGPRVRERPAGQDVV
jgi:hypothetical protein